MEPTRVYVLTIENRGSANANLEGIRRKQDQLGNRADTRLHSLDCSSKHIPQTVSATRSMLTFIHAELENRIIII